jgi:hypothetical protein
MQELGKRPQAAREALDILSPLEGPLAQLASASHNHGAALVQKDQQELIRLHWAFSLIAGSLILIGVVLIVLLNRHNRLLGP